MNDRVAEKLKKLFIGSVNRLEEDTEQIKQFISSSTDLLGYPIVDNEELTWNGNREEMEQKKQAKEEKTNGPIVRGIGITIEKNAEYKSEG